MTKLILDWEKTLVLCNNNESLARELLGMLKTDLPQQKQILIDAYDREQWRMLRDIIHQILGSCSYIALPELKAAAEAMQDAIHQNKIDLSEERQAVITAIDHAILLKPTDY